jgi:hypothetical protein
VPAQTSPPSGPSVRGPQVVLIDVRALRRLRAALGGESTAVEIEELIADLEYLIERAAEAGWPL